MPPETVFAALFDLAIELQANPVHSKLTNHHEPDRAAVRARLQASILQNVMPGESPVTSWQRLRIFCLNHVNRAQPPVAEKAVRSLLDSIEEKCANQADRIHALASCTPSQLSGSRPSEFVRALSRIASSVAIPELGHVSYLDWLDQRWNFWVQTRVQDISINALLHDIAILSQDPVTKIPGMGLPLAANFMADLGLSAFAKPDLHVLPVVSLVQLSVERKDEERQAIMGLVKISQAENQLLAHAREFDWLMAAGGLWPRFLDRLIYLIGSDNFKLDGVKCKQQAPRRRLLMRQVLLERGLLDGRYC